MKQGLLLLLLFVALHARAQSDFRPGYALTLTGDTLRGQVDYRGNTRNTRVCQFRSTASAATTEYTPDQLRGYGVSGGQQYLSTELPGKVPTKVFMQIIVQGGLSIFRYTDTDDKEFFYARKGAEPLQALVQRDTTINTFDKYTRLQTSSRQRQYFYRNVLWSRMADCPAAQVMLPKVSLVQSELAKVGQAYNQCKGTAQYAVTKPASRLRYSVMAGVYQSAVLALDDAEENVALSSTRPTFGAAVQILPGGFSPKLSLLFQAMFLQQVYDKAYNGKGMGFFAGTTVPRTIHLELTSVRLPLMLRYTFLNRTVQPYIQGGPVAVLNFNSNATRSDYNSVNKTTYTREVPIRSYGFGVMAGGGLAFALHQRHSVFVEVRADMFDNTSQARRSFSGMRGVSLMGGYTFGN
ncbi:Outer membrane protein beta-barrel domain-containing protein [Hymenobacter daecheongensis DSM 21074]|uniref:Outer membrane protein beta-barrel domain-containing protein n=1 Tax=Hymenobacter daecheongensis DSM 21074 TaxID=1121955 RepID=A0A1M6CF39_9BACT|nr:outer membrane beta-barrel protein [Hymenobacter daecheongensis]SHI59629.1 Outer membrane protein beta-barrel domain-containing protein [Hymenobacter daecheongensis DSM 21074]